MSAKPAGPGVLDYWVEPVVATVGVLAAGALAVMAATDPAIRPVMGTLAVVMLAANALWAYRVALTMWSMRRGRDNGSAGA